MDLKALLVVFSVAKSPILNLQYMMWLPCSAWYSNTNTWHCIRRVIRSQCRADRIGVKCSYFDKREMSLVALSYSLCNLYNYQRGRPEEHSSDQPVKPLNHVLGILHLRLKIMSALSNLISLSVTKLSPESSHSWHVSSVTKLKSSFATYISRLDANI